MIIVILLKFTRLARKRSFPVVDKQRKNLLEIRFWVLITVHQIKSLAYHIQWCSCETLGMLCQLLNSFSIFIFISFAAEANICNKPDPVNSSLISFANVTSFSCCDFEARKCSIADNNKTIRFFKNHNFAGKVFVVCVQHT